MRNKNRSSSRQARPGATGGALSVESRARQALDGARHREAVELYKELLKQERRPEWVDGLAESYAGRARELADKRMLPEALVVWRNRASLCDRPLAEGPYVDLLLRAGEYELALGLLASVDSSSAAGSELATRLAAVALTAPESALAQLSADHLLLRHRLAALAALSACCRGDPAELDAQLQAIPFRSPYRDLRFILKALSLVSDDPAQAADLIARIRGDCPFEKLAAVVRAAIQPGSGWLAAMIGLDEECRRLLLELKGCPENRRPLLLEVAELARKGTPPAPSRVVDLLLRRSRGLPASAARLCRRLLPFSEKRLAEYRHAYGPLSEAERECILARSGEIRDDGYFNHGPWLRAARLLAPAAPLQAALILRHLFEATVNDDAPRGPDHECITWLERSLALDPDDRATHLKLIGIHRQKQDLKAARTGVDAALARFPNDPAVLMEAVETALAGNAFKKAVTLAKRLLELDPINLPVRALIGQAHLSHARKQIRSHRPEAACRELDQAEQWLTSANDRSLVKLLRGLSTDAAQATALLGEAAAELGGKLLAGFQVLLESLRVGGQVAGALRRAAVDLSGIPPAGDVLAVIRGLNALGEADQRTSRTVLEPLRAPLKRSAAGEFSQSERISICETLLRCEESALLAAYADAGLTCWPERPIFVYFAIAAKHGSAAFLTISEDERLALDRALAVARDEGDERTVLRIGELKQPWGHYGGADPDDYDEFDPFNDSDDDEAAFDGLLPLDPRAICDMLISYDGPDAVIQRARGLLPESTVKAFERAAGGNRRKLAERLLEHLLKGDPEAPQPAPKPRPRAPRLPRGQQPVVDDRQKGLFDD
jgi:tetratricopeptide (TPR) repeat protein